jgi:phosphate:Na+ symporter
MYYSILLHGYNEGYQMDFGIYKILMLFGSLGLFLFGMKLMSEALQKVAGMGMRNILAAITSNKFKSIVTGLFITMLIQSSSATTVMVVSFVNAGLLSLVESVGIILGANIGTTFTAWLISLLGFNVRISSLALPIIGLSFYLIFSSKSRSQYLGEFIIGFAIIFLGLEFLKNSVPDISSNPEIIKFVSDYTHMGFLSVLLFLFLGFTVTAIVQSSSVAMALTIVMSYKGWIGFDLAAAMILGENIGTTITANLAAVVANGTAKKAARTHFIINLLGISWMIIVFQPFIRLVDLIVIKLNGVSPLENISSIPLGLAVFHSTFNIINVTILAWFIPGIIKISTTLVRKRKNEDEHFSLKHITTGILSTSELSLLQARREIANYGRKVNKMFSLVRNLFSETNEIEFQNIYKTISGFENYADHLEIEIANYLTKISEGELSQPGVQRLRLMLKLVDSIENIADSCNSISKTLRRKKKNKIWFTQDLRNNVNAMFDIVGEALNTMLHNLDSDYKHVDTEKAAAIEKRINKTRKHLQKTQITSVENRSYTYQAGIIYTDILAQCENLGDNIYAISDALSEYNQNLT